MRFCKTILIIAVCLLQSASSAVLESPTSRIDPTLARDLVLIRNFRDNPSALNAARLKFFDLPIEKDPVLHVFLHFRTPPGEKVYAWMENIVKKVYPGTWVPPIGAHKTGFMLAEVQSSRIDTLFTNKVISRITAAYRRLQPLNDLTAEETGAELAWQAEPPLTGEGIRVLIIDSGFQLDHPDLPDPVFAWDFADWPDTSEDVTDLVSGHGTHTAGTAFGSGVLSDGLFRGMAPDAEAMYIKIGDDSTSSASTEAVVGAIRAAGTWAEADIVNMSYGGWDGFNDGSSVEEQVVDFAVSRGTNVFMSAGNSAFDTKHYYGSVNAGERTGRIRVNIRRTPVGTLWYARLVYYDGPDTSVHNRLTASIVDEDGEDVWIDDPIWVSSPRGAEGIDYLPMLPLESDTTVFYFYVRNDSEVEQDFHIHVWADEGSVRFTQFDHNYSILLPSTADSCISVAAYTHRTNWRDFRGTDHDDLTIRGEIASFSSIGPRIDGVLKPDITAPGKRTVSCRNSDIISLNGPSASLIVSNNGDQGEPADYIAIMGTSMSSPAAAGASALILQSDPEMRPWEFRARLFGGARTDSSTGDVPNTRWGWGKLDVMQALDINAHSWEKPAAPKYITISAVYPNPFNSGITVEYIPIEPGPLNLVITDCLGRELLREIQFVTSPGTNKWTSGSVFGQFASGTYYLKAGGGSTWTVTRIALLK